MTINREATIRWKGYDPDDLSYGSDKKVWSNCDICGKGRWLKRNQYSDLCFKCSRNTPEAIEANRLRAIKQFSNPATREAARLKTIEYNKTHPEIITNSEAAKANADNMRGGHDIVEHHWLYDDADLSKYTMPMTRSEHSSMHNRMRADGYNVPHINSETDDNGLWGYQ